MVGVEMTGLPPSEQMLAFKAVAELGSFTLAAHHLGLSQSAVSHQIRRLENHIGFRLFVRSSQAVTLTDFGERFYSIVAQPLDALTSGIESLGDPMNPRRLIIQVESGFAAAWLSPRLKKFSDVCRNVQVEQRRASTLNFRDGAELAIKWGNGNWPHYSAEKLIEVEYTPICSPALREKIQTVQDLRGQTLIHDRQYREWKLWLELAGVKNVEVRKGHVVDDTNILIDMAIAGQGVALSSSELAYRALNNGQLVLLFPELKLTTGEAYYIVTRKKTSLSEKARAFIDWLKAEVTEYGSER